MDRGESGVLEGEAVGSEAVSSNAAGNRKPGARLRVSPASSYYCVPEGRTVITTFPRFCPCMQIHQAPCQLTSESPQDVTFEIPVTLVELLVRFTEGWARAILARRAILGCRSGRA